MRSVIQIIFCSCVNETTLSPSCDHSCVKMADCFTDLSKSDLWSNNNKNNKLGYRKISWFVSVSNITIFCSTLSKLSIIYRKWNITDVVQLIIFWVKLFVFSKHFNWKKPILTVNRLCQEWKVFHNLKNPLERNSATPTYNRISYCKRVAFFSFNCIVTVT